MSQSSPVVLASGRLTHSGDTISIELRQPVGHPPAVLLRWPEAPSVIETLLAQSPPNLRSAT